MSITNDYNVPWDGVDDDDKGLLEPVNLGNISAYGFGMEEKKLIENVPEGGLVSCYIHPEDAFSPVKEWTNHLKKCCDALYFRADCCRDLQQRIDEACGVRTPLTMSTTKAGCAGWTNSPSFRVADERSIFVLELKPRDFFPIAPDRLFLSPGNLDILRYDVFACENAQPP